MEYYLKSYQDIIENDSKDHEIQKGVDNNIQLVKAICSHGYTEALLDNFESAKKSINECREIIESNVITIKDEHDAREIYFPLYLYYDHLKNHTQADKFLNLAYQAIEDKLITKYHQRLDRNTNPKYFWCKDIITAYENNKN